jgi:hypothetical protein
MTGGVHLSVGHEERVKAARLEALPHEEGGNRVRRHRRAGRLGRSRGRGPMGRGEWPVKKTSGPRLGRVAAGPIGPKTKKKNF